MKYIKQLDSLRAIAVLLVIVSHWIPKGNIINRFTPNGSIGVNIFFVLSGFLISKILFDNKNDAENSLISKGNILKNFYGRRTLRIFPIYYLAILIILIFHASTYTHIKPAFIFLATYTSNFYFFHLQNFDGIISHLWSLAVEEQFYLFWPLIILYTKRHYLLHVITSFVLIGVVCRFLLRDVPMADVLTFSCFDAFGLGALLSWQITYGVIPMKKFYRILTFCASVSTALFFWSIVPDQTVYLPQRTLISIIALWLITYIILNADSNRPLFKVVWNNKILIFIGKISYGLYLYHNLIPRFNLNIVNVYLNPLLPDILFKKNWGALYLAENTILLLSVSWFSFVFIEKKFLLLKKYFQYDKNKNTEAADSTFSPGLVTLNTQTEQRTEYSYAEAIQHSGNNVKPLLVLLDSFMHLSAFEVEVEGIRKQLIQNQSEINILMLEASGIPKAQRQKSEIKTEELERLSKDRIRLLRELKEAEDKTYSHRVAFDNILNENLKNSGDDLHADLKLGQGKFSPEFEEAVKSGIQSRT